MDPEMNTVQSLCSSQPVPSHGYIGDIGKPPNEPEPRSLPSQAPHRSLAVTLNQSRRPFACGTGAPSGTTVPGSAQQSGTGRFTLCVDASRLQYHRQGCRRSRQIGIGATLGTRSGFRSGWLPAALPTRSRRRRAPFAAGICLTV